jgi:omega-6 fatty acid desaturase (delta-12 desaturase)
MNAATATQTALPLDKEVSSSAPAVKSTEAPVKWQKLVAPYRGGDTKRSLLQFATTFLGFGATCALSLYSLQWSVWPALLLALPAAGFLVRIFIIQHDCGHGSYFPSQRANDLLGTLCGMVMMTPYYEWRRSHAIHHAGSGNLAARGVGDVYTMTLKEYREHGFWRRLQYRAFRNPLVLFVIGPIFVFFIIHRIPGALTHTKGPLKERLNVHLTTLGSLAIFSTEVMVFGWQGFLLSFFLPAYLAAMAGIWLFYVQHQYEDVYWRHADDWNYEVAGLEGSSYYRLPRILQYFSGNIGFHHIHHLAPKVPNYALERCYRENPYFQNALTLTLWESLSTMKLKFYDEESQKMVGYEAV